MDGLEDFLSAEQPVETQAAEPAPEAPVEAPSAAETPTEAAEPTEQVERPRGPDGKFIAKGAAEPVEGASPAPQEPPLDHAALIGERRRRQEAEQQLEELKAKLSQPQPQAQQAPEGPPDRWEDPEGHDQWLVQQASQLAEDRAMGVVQQQRIYESAVRARAKYEDYDAAHATFGEMAQNNPGLFQQMFAAVDPAEFAYQAAKTEMEIRQYGGMDKLIEARVQAALTQHQQPGPASAPIPDTLADAQSARGGSAEGYSVPTLDDILKR